MVARSAKRRFRSLISACALWSSASDVGGSADLEAAGTLELLSLGSLGGGDSGNCALDAECSLDPTGGDEKCMGGSGDLELGPAREPLKNWASKCAANLFCAPPVTGSLLLGVADAGLAGAGVPSSPSGVKCGGVAVADALGCW